MDNHLLTYNAIDSAVDYEVWAYIERDMLEEGYLRTYELSIQHFDALQFMMSRGILFDRQGLDTTRTRIRSLEGQKREELNKLAGRNLDPMSSKDCQKYFYLEKDITPYLHNKTKKPTVDDTALQRLARGTSNRKGLYEAKLIQEIRGLNKLSGTYLEIQFDPDGRLRCSYNPRGTRFGRLSSSATIRGTGTNMQNLPPEFKQFLIPDPGYFFVEVDKRQAEWVVVAYLSGDAGMLEVIEQEKDPHTNTASRMFSVPEEFILLDAKTIGSSTDENFIIERRRATPQLIPWIPMLPRHMSSRQAGKKSNHGLNYDEGYVTFSLMNEIPEGEGRHMVELYHAIYPNIRNVYYTQTKQRLSRDRTLENCFGRKYRFMQDWGDKLFKAAYSFQPQSSVVDSINIGMKECYDNTFVCGTAGCNADLLAQVHDSLLFQFPLTVLANGSDFHRAMLCIYSAVSPQFEYGGRSFKIATDMKIGTNWGTYHSTDNPLGMREIPLTDNPSTFLVKVQEILNVEDASKLVR